MKFIPAKCPSCNGELQVPDDKDFVLCMYCGVNVKVREAIKIKDVPPISLKANTKFKDEIRRKNKIQLTMYTRMWFSIAICIVSFFLFAFMSKIPVLSTILALVFIISFILAIIFFFIGVASGRSEAEDIAYKMTEAFENDEK